MTNSIDHWREWGQRLFWKLRALLFSTILVSWQPNAQSSHYCTSIISSGTQFLVLPSVTCECLPKILELFYPLHSLAIRTDQGFLKDELPQFWPCLFSFRRWLSWFKWICKYVVADSQIKNLNASLIIKTPLRSNFVSVIQQLRDYSFSNFN